MLQISQIAATLQRLAEPSALNPSGTQSGNEDAIWQEPISPAANAVTTSEPWESAGKRPEQHAGQRGFYRTALVFSVASEVFVLRGSAVVIA